MRVSDGPLWGRSRPRSRESAPDREFQTDPCGVEASRTHSRHSRKTSFRRTLVGSKPLVLDCALALERVSDGPLWGRSLQLPVGSTVRTAGFRRTLVGSKLAPRGATPHRGRVSDGPLWGRSRRCDEQRRHQRRVSDGLCECSSVSGIPGFQRDPQGSDVDIFTNLDVCTAQVVRA